MYDFCIFHIKTFLKFTWAFILEMGALKIYLDILFIETTYAQGYALL